MSSFVGSVSQRNPGITKKERSAGLSKTAQERGDPKSGITKKERSSGLSKTAQERCDPQSGIVRKERHKSPSLLNQSARETAQNLSDATQYSTVTTPGVVTPVEEQFKGFK